MKKLSVNLGIIPGLGQSAMPVPLIGHDLLYNRAGHEPAHILIRSPMQVRQAGGEERGRGMPRRSFDEFFSLFFSNQ